MPGFLNNLSKEEKILVLFGIAFGIAVTAAFIGGLICVLTEDGYKKSNPGHGNNHFLFNAEYVL